MNVNFAIYLIIASLTLPLFAQVQPVPRPRTALLMGVWSYNDPSFPALPQRGILKDLESMKTTLEALGFQVTLSVNPSLGDAKTAVDKFGSLLKARGGASLFYFTGHGAEHEGKNYLIPTGTAVSVAADLNDEALTANRILTRMEGAGTKVNLLFLDCCRNTLTKAGGSIGLAPMSARGALIGFATRSGEIAETSASGSPYTTALVAHLKTPGLSLPDMHTLVTQEFENSRQRPGSYVDLGGIYQLNPKAALVEGGEAQEPRRAREPSDFESLPNGEPIVLKTWQNIPTTKSEDPDAWWAWSPFGGIRSFWANLKEQISLQQIEQLVGAPIFVSGPHSGGTIRYTDAEFGHYNPEFVKRAKGKLIPSSRTSAFRVATQSAYDSDRVKKLARLHWLVHRKLTNDPQLLRDLVSAYSSVLAKIKKAPGTAVSKELESDFRWQWFYFLNDRYSASQHYQLSDFDSGGVHGNVVNTAVAFWLRRSMDGTFDAFGEALEQLLKVYDPDWLRYPTREGLNDG